MNNKTPQLEDGFTRIANDILDGLSKTNLSSYQSRIVYAIFRKTYGWHKKEDFISISQLVEMTGLHKAHASRAKKELIERNIVTNRGNKIGFQKNASLWLKLPIGVTTHSAVKVTNRGNRVTNRGNKKLPIGADTKEKKETITKERDILDMFNKAMKTKYRTVPHKNLEYWLSIYSLEEIGEAIGNIPKDGFWKDKMSLEVLFRRKDPKGNDVDRIGSLLNRKSDITSSYKKYDPNDPNNI